MPSKRAATLASKLAREARARRAEGARKAQAPRTSALAIATTSGLFSVAPGGALVKGLAGDTGQLVGVEKVLADIRMQVDMPLGRVG